MSAQKTKVPSRSFSPSRARKPLRLRTNVRAGGDVVHFTLEVRVNRIDMA